MVAPIQPEKSLKTDSGAGKSQAETVSNQNKPEQVTISRKLTLYDAELIAQKVAKRMTETGACLLLGIKPATWYQWKLRANNGRRFEEVLTRIRESRIEACIDTIHESGEPYEVQTKNGSFTRPGDWRAKAWLVERVLAPERFSDAQTQAPTVNQLGQLSSVLERVFSSLPDKSEKRVLDAIEVKALPSPEQPIATTGTGQLWEGKECNG